MTSNAVDKAVPTLFFGDEINDAAASQETLETPGMRTVGSGLTAGRARLNAQIRHLGPLPAGLSRAANGRKHLAYHGHKIVRSGSWFQGPCSPEVVS